MIDELIDELQLLRLRQGQAEVFGNVNLDLLDQIFEGRQGKRLARADCAFNLQKAEGRGLLVRREGLANDLLVVLGEEIAEPVAAVALAGPGEDKVLSLVR